MTDAQTAQRIAEPIRVTAFGADAEGLVHLLPDHSDTTARCGAAHWHSYVTCVDWLEERTCPVCLADLALDLGAEIPADVLAELDELAAPWPGRWLLRPREGDLERVVGVCAGPGGWDEGLRALGARYDAVSLDLSNDACVIAERAGHRRIVTDITLLDPEHPALRWTVGLIISPPCPAWSTAGKRAGLTARSLTILTTMLRAVGKAAGHGRRERSGTTWAEIRAMAAAMPDPGAGLIAEVLIWALGLQLHGETLRWAAMEQSANLPAEVREAVSSELALAGWSQQQWVELDAADYGVATHRHRVFLMAVRYGRIPGSVRPAAPFAEQTLAAALGWDEGERVNTRGVRGLDANGRPKGGNTFSADRPGWCLTGKARTWFRESDGLRLTEAEAGQLVGFHPAYPWRAQTPQLGREISRTSAFQRIGDVVCPPVGAVILGALTGRPWRQLVENYLARVYAGASAPTPVETPQHRPRRTPADLLALAA
ncbi:DNA cytosine methyltransferase [Streptomyces sp. NPDC056503]|uniref:DNA cytosine methyltransferase n=1 Tax=Streptomyces sp. NPDC056503 TaxID=3345842 RepID=UPI0036AD4F88